jgi:hypothetical protein
LANQREQLIQFAETPSVFPSPIILLHPSQVQASVVFGFAAWTPARIREGLVKLTFTLNTTTF